MQHLIVCGSSACVYIFLLISLRLFGKKEIAQLSMVDLVFILLISNSVQNAMIGSDPSFVGGLSAAVTLFSLNFILKLLVYRFPKLSNIVQGRAVMLIYEGEIIEENLHKTRISVEELEKTLREHGVTSANEVNLAVLEIDGNISVISKDFQSRSKHLKHIGQAEHIKHTERGKKRKFL